MTKQHSRGKDDSAEFDRIMKDLDKISPLDTAALLRLTRRLVRYAKSMDELELEEQELLRQRERSHLLWEQLHNSRVPPASESWLPC